VAEFGTDLLVTLSNGVFDLDPTGAVDTPEHALAMAVARRFVVERGGLFYDPEYGLDLRQYLNKGMTRGELFRLRFLVQSEAEKDERIISAEADVQFTSAQTLVVKLECTTALGPFSLTLSVSSLTVELLSLET
jgi:hypothetical protein